MKMSELIDLWSQSPTDQCHIALGASPAVADYESAIAGLGRFVGEGHNESDEGIFQAFLF
jgi:hypothetical protein